MLDAVYGKRVVVIDLDPHTNATVMLMGDERWEKLNDQRWRLPPLCLEWARTVTNRWHMKTRRFDSVPAIRKPPTQSPSGYSAFSVPTGFTCVARQAGSK